MPALPRQLGPYRLLERLGVGGMCEVYLAVVYGASGFEKLVAIKTLLPDYQGNGEFERLLIKEAAIGASLQHRNLVQVHDFGVSEGVYYLRMDYVDGGDLRKLSRITRPSAPLSLLIAEEVAMALDYLHRRTDDKGLPLGLVHRDVSPSNILLSRSGEVKLADFGIAKATRRADGTHGQIRKGKYAYMSPEQVAGETLTPASDHFSLGITLMEMLTGRRPYDGESALQTMDRIRAAEPPDLDDVKPAFRPLIARCLRREPEDRFRSTGALYRALVRVRRNLPPTGPPNLSTHVQRILDGKPAPPDEDIPTTSPGEPTTQPDIVL